jgi:myosin heavy subunit
MLGWRQLTMVAVLTGSLDEMRDLKRRRTMMLRGMTSRTLALCVLGVGVLSLAPANLLAQSEPSNPEVLQKQLAEARALIEQQRADLKTARAQLADKDAEMKRRQDFQEKLLERLFAEQEENKKLAEQLLKVKKALDTSLASEKASKDQTELLLAEKAAVARKLRAQGFKETDSIAAAVDNLFDKLSNLKAEAEARDKRLLQLTSSLAEKEADLKELKEVVKTIETEVKRRQNDYEKLRTTLFALQTEATNLINARNNAERSEAQARIERKNALDRASQLEAENRKLAEDLIRLKLQDSNTLSGKNPPATKVEGKVTQVEEGLVKLNVGSDQGLKEGHTLEVFRLSSTPGKSRYLGTLRIVKVSPNESVGQMTAKLAEKVQVGDEVAPTTDPR